MVAEAHGLVKVAGRRGVPPWPHRARTSSRTSSPRGQVARPTSRQRALAGSGGFLAAAAATHTNSRPRQRRPAARGVRPRGKREARTRPRRSRAAGRGPNRPPSRPGPPRRPRPPLAWLPSGWPGLLSSSRR